ncbi:hypothetical protein [Spirosoma areae]
MKTSHLRQWLISLLLIATALSCIDHRVPVVSPGIEPSRLRVKTITQETPNNPTRVSAFKYDGQNRLSLIIGFQTPDSSAAPVENTVYQYDAQNRLTQVNRRIVRRGSYSETYEYAYNGAGQVSRLNHLPSTYTIEPQYTADNRVSGYRKSLGVSGLQYSGSGTFTFPGNNLTLTNEGFSVFRSGGPSIPFTGGSASTTFTFDDKINPFYGVFLIPAPGVFSPLTFSGQFGPYYTYYGGINNFFNLSQNNVLSAVLSGGATTVYGYTYNAANLPTKRVKAVDNSVVETLYYEYETY